MCGLFDMALCVFCVFCLSVCVLFYVVLCILIECLYFLFYFAFVFRLRARAAWEPLNGWPHTPTGGGLPLQWSLFLFFIFFCGRFFLFLFHLQDVSFFNWSSRGAWVPQNGWLLTWAAPSTKLLFNIRWIPFTIIVD